jgi:MFS family permease
MFSRILAWTGNSPDPARTFLRWTGLRAGVHRGYVLVSGLYFVVDIGMSAAQLVVLGAVVAVTLLLSDIPGGVWSDAVSRKRALLLGHGFLAAGMVLTGVATGFGLVVVTQVLWGLGWAFSGGADVAWLADELDRPDRVDRALVARARWDPVGGAAGLVAFGVLGWATGLVTAIVVSGAGMALLGGYVAARFAEDTPIPTGRGRWSASLAILTRGVLLAHRDNDIRIMMIATTLLNGAAVITWLFPARLVYLGFPNNLILSYTALGILGSALGAAALRIVEKRIAGVAVARRSYALSCAVGVLGLVLLAVASNAVGGVPESCWRAGSRSR